MKKGAIQILAWDATILVALVCLGFFGLHAFLTQGFSDPARYTFRSPNQSHQALFVQEGFQDRSWTLFVESEKGEKPVRVASLDFDGAYMFNGAEWSKDGQVIVATVRLMGGNGNYDQVRAFGYDFATRKALVAEWNRWREYETNVLSVVMDHGGFNGAFVCDRNMTTGAEKIWVWQIPE